MAVGGLVEKEAVKNERYGLFAHVIIGLVFLFCGRLVTSNPIIVRQW